MNTSHRNLADTIIAEPLPRGTDTRLLPRVLCWNCGKYVMHLLYRIESVSLSIVVLPGVVQCRREGCMQWNVVGQVVTVACEESEAA